MPFSLTFFMIKSVTSTKSIRFLLLYPVITKHFTIGKGKAKVKVKS